MHLRTSCVVVAAALAASGCGGAGSPKGTESVRSTSPAAAPSDAESAYVVRMRALGASLAAATSLAGARNSASAPAKDAANLVRVQRALRRTAAGLEAITPPGPVRADHALLLKGVREYASELSGVIRRVRSGQVAALHSIPSLRGLHDMKRASDAFLQKGYQIVP
jgi:hypothetical protein